jgi:hypothetical protein
MVTSTGHAVAARPAGVETGAGGLLTTAVNQRAGAHRLCRAAALVRKTRRALAAPWCVITQW